MGVVVRLSDKLSRIMQLTKKALEGRLAAVKGTLINLVNYSILCTTLCMEWVKGGKVMALSRKSDIAIKMITEMKHILDSIGVPK
jgi:hypothetical protein